MNRNLVKGAEALSTPTQPAWNDSLVAGYMEGDKISKIAQQYARVKKDAINQKVAGYIDSLDTNVDVTELTEDQQKAVTTYLVDQRNEYAVAASQIAKIEDPSSPMYSELRDKINGIQMSFKNLAGQVNSYKKDKASYLKDFDNNLISDGNELSTLSESANLYTNGASLGVGQGGGLVFWNENKQTYNSYNQMPKPFLKDFAASDELLKMNSDVYNSGQALTGARKNMMRQKLSNIISKGGRSSLLSMASDDFIIEGGLGIQDPELFKPGNDDALKQSVMDSYMDVLSDSAAQGANDKRPASKRGSGGYSGALKDEVNVSGPVANNALEFSKFSTPVAANQRENKSREMVNIINSIDPASKQAYASRGEFYDMWTTGYDLDDNEETRAKFSQQYGPSQIFSINPKDVPGSKPLAINTDDPYELYEFYLKNTGLSTKARNHYLTNFDRQKKESNPKQTKTNNNPSTGGGSLDNI